MDQQKKIYKARELPLRISVHHLCISMTSISQHTTLTTTSGQHTQTALITTFSSVSSKKIPVQVLQDHSTLAKTQEVVIWLQKNILSSNWNTNTDKLQVQLFAQCEHITETSLSTVCFFYFKWFYSWNCRVSFYWWQIQERLKTNCLKHPKRNS